MSFVVSPARRADFALHLALVSIEESGIAEYTGGGGSYRSRWSEPELEALEVTDVSTGWYDAGVVDGKNKLVPSLTFRLRNKGATAHVRDVTAQFPRGLVLSASAYIMRERRKDGGVQAESQTGGVGNPAAAIAAR